MAWHMISNTHALLPQSIDKSLLFTSIVSGFHKLHVIVSVQQQQQQQQQSTVVAYTISMPWRVVPHRTHRQLTDHRSDT